MTTSNSLTLIPVNSIGEKLEKDKEYILKLHFFSVWTDGDVRITGSIEPHTCAAPAPAIDYESQEFQDELEEILDDTATEGDGRWKPKHLIHHLQKRGYRLIRAEKDE